MSNLSDQAQKLIDAEIDVVKTVIDSLNEQHHQALLRLETESDRARSLTSDLVAARRVEDKVMLASDEAVAHGLTSNKQNEIKSIERLLKKPYFARLVLKEHQSDGAEREIEYKLGFAANPDCRIIDWRKAPIAKLYYEYKEGEAYSENILGRERNGEVSLRHSVEIENGQLKKLSCGLGHFVRDNDHWISLEQPQRSRHGASASESVGQLPHILSLITPEQFKLITEDAETAILIQGIAGSGKTTVALHRLAWLLHEDNSPLKAEDAVVLVQSQALKNYISGTLPSIDIHGVRVVTFKDWAMETVLCFAPHLRLDKILAKRPQDPCPHSIERLKNSFAWLNVIEKYADRSALRDGELLEDRLIKLLEYPAKILAEDETRLLDAELVTKARERALKLHEASCLDLCDDAGMLRLCQLISGSVKRQDGSSKLYEHIVVDEIQDYSPAALATLLGSVHQSRQLTLVGDIAQRTNTSSEFPGWDRLRERWALKDSVSKYISLTVSHRSTLPIMQLADYIQKRQAVTTGRPGRVPIWFKCRKEQKAVKSAIDWLIKAAELYPLALTAVICIDPKEAKYVHSLLQPNFGNSLRLGTDSDFSFEPGLLVTDVRQVKGLEFSNVVIWNASEKNYPKNDFGRNSLYIAVTRAEENLCLISYGKPSENLPSVFSKLVRGIEVEAEGEG